MCGDAMVFNQQPLISFGLKIFFIFLLSVLSILASTTSSAQSVKDAVEAAWLRSPLGQSSAARSAEFQAKTNAAQRLFAEPPSIAIGQRTDRLNRNRGAREDEVELTLPIRPWGSKRADESFAFAAADAQQTVLTNAKLLLAGQVREAYWATVLADIEHKLAQAKSAQAIKFAEDIARRVAAGDMAKVDENRAEADKDLAFIARAETDFKFRQAVRQFTQLTGLVLGAAVAETPSKKSFLLAAHPAYIAQISAIARAKAKADIANRVTRDPYELTLTTTRERSAVAEAGQASATSSARIGIRIPFATASRNQPRITEAAAERIEAEAALPLLALHLDSEYTAADSALPRLRDLVVTAQRRAKLAAETAALIDKSFSVGEADLPMKLRADADRYEAERVAERIKIEYERAVSHLNQTLGQLP